MRYDKKLDLIRTELVEDLYGGMATKSDIKIDSIDCFIAPETISYMDLGNGQKVAIGTTKIFTKAKIDSKTKENMLKLVYMTDRYEISAITDLGKITMIEVERHV